MADDYGTRVALTRREQQSWEERVEMTLVVGCGR